MTGSRKPKGDEERAYRRTAFERELIDWKSLRFFWDTTVNSVEISRANNGLVAAFNLNELQQAMQPEHFELLRILYEELLCQAMMANEAVPLARSEMTIQAARSEGGMTTAQQRKDEAKNRAQEDQTKADEIRKVNPRLSNRDVARRLAERGTVPSAGTTRKRISRNPRKPR